MMKTMNWMKFYDLDSFTEGPEETFEEDDIDITDDESTDYEEP